MIKLRKAPPPAASSIDVIAQRSLGAKARIVWLAAGERELVVAVTPQGVRMLGQWRRRGDAGLGVGPIAHEPRLPEALALPEAPPRPSSPAVAGILRLRAKTVAPAISEEVATEDGDADALWAREILAATGGRR
jgi:hypothetical protein